MVLVTASMCGGGMVVWRGVYGWGFLCMDDLFVGFSSLFYYLVVV